MFNFYIFKCKMYLNFEIVTNLAVTNFIIWLTQPWLKSRLKNDMLMDINKKYKGFDLGLPNPKKGVLKVGFISRFDTCYSQ